MLQLLEALLVTWALTETVSRMLKNIYYLKVASNFEQNLSFNIKKK